MEEFLKQNQRANVGTIGKLGPIDDSIIARILPKVQIPDTELLSSCWIWKGTVGDIKKGHQHGILWYNKKYVQVHRLMYHNFVEDVPVFINAIGTLCVLHICTHENNGRCINPRHMRLGTPKENIEDSIQAGTKRKCASGEKNHNATLSDTTVQAIKLLKDSGLTQAAVARMYDVNQSQISRWWRDITRS